MITQNVWHANPEETQGEPDIREHDKQQTSGFRAEESRGSAVNQFTKINRLLPSDKVPIVVELITYTKYVMELAWSSPKNLPALNEKHPTSLPAYSPLTTEN